MFETVRKVYYGMWKYPKQNQKKKKKIAHREWMHLYILYKGYAFDRFSLEYISIYECQEKKHNGNQNLSHSL